MTSARPWTSGHSLFTHQDRKSTRLNSSHGYISYAVFCLKKKKTLTHNHFRLAQLITLLRLSSTLSTDNDLDPTDRLHVQLCTRHSYLSCQYSCLVSAGAC